ncbi:ThiF family adenylyltransferase [Anaerorhabdus furcosa]|uniref:ThiF family protein n=1 Tax=Anaerorhabdus furcosa TaxID=118967 RepID=A0A1T4LZ74_9FIRM|nr:ThiF family adenylyltransferase [Anaerorhabdus furcosa]SJZ60039.1 ThiF family protein [Anaerorhabdus furcosa]
MNYHFYIVGVGGTGSLLARDMPKLLIGSNCEMTLIDGDIVEGKNMKRQSYQTQDIGENKAIALSKKINTFYGTNCYAIDRYITESDFFEVIQKESRIPVIVGCVDNDATRKVCEKVVKRLKQCIYIDSANSEYSGDIYICVKSNKEIKGALRGKTYKLKKDKHPNELSCQEQASKGNVQFLITNNKMACVLLEHIHLLLINQLKVGVTNVERLKTVHY